MIQFEGPYSFKDADDLKTPVYMYKPGGVRMKIGEATVKVDGGMTFDVQLDEEYKDIEMAAFEVPMRYTYLNLPDAPRFNWAYNCLTYGVHHGLPERIWKLPLIQATQMFGAEKLKELVITRIYNDAMMYVEHSPLKKETGEPMSMTQEWADKVKEYAQEAYLNTLKDKIHEISTYYESESWRNEQEAVINRIKQNKLNPNYAPLHDHDSINLLCRIIGVLAGAKATEDLAFDI